MKLLIKIFKVYVWKTLSLMNIKFGMGGEEYSKFASLV